MSAQSDSILGREYFFSSRVIATLVACAVTGLVTLYYPIAGIWPQWTYLAHTFLGISLSLVFLPYFVTHFRRVVGLRQLWVSIVGLLSVFCITVTIVTGLVITILGQSESRRYIYDVHTLASIILLATSGVHLAFAKRRPSGRKPFVMPWKDTARRALAYSLGMAAVIGLATTAYRFLPLAYEDVAAIRPYSLPYGEHPFRPSQTESAQGAFVDSRRIGDSGRCGTCHEQITSEWQASIHAQAASDKAYQTNVNLLAKKKGMPTTRYCEGCHAPVALLSGQLAEGGKLDTVGHMQEGVSCMACHGVDRIIHTKGVASYRFAPPSPYLFEGYQGWLAVKLHNFVLRIQPRQHRQDMARSPLATPELCASCHVQFMDKDVNNWGWVQMQDEYIAWLASPYSRQTKQTFSEGALQRCQDCHFPLIKGEDPSANTNGLFRSHRAIGANTAIPWFTGNRKQLEETEKFLRADRVRISFDIPDRLNAVRSHQHVAPAASDSSEPPDYYYLGETLTFNVVVTNAQVGHNFPGGTTDINEAWLHVKLTDGQSRTIFESGNLEENGEVAPSAYHYRSIPIDRLGNPVWKHDLFNMVGDSFKRVIPAGKSDIVPYQAKIPGWAKSPLTISAVVRYRKLNPQYARWALDDRNVDLPIVDMAGESLTVPIHIKPEVDTAPDPS
jgi:putative effector of murein hydrolase LrgA (UPF0299 family)